MLTSRESKIAQTKPTINWNCLWMLYSQGQVVKQINEAIWHLGANTLLSANKSPRIICLGVIESKNEWSLTPKSVKRTSIWENTSSTCKDPFSKSIQSWSWVYKLRGEQKSSNSEVRKDDTILVECKSKNSLSWVSKKILHPWSKHFSHIMFLGTLPN